MKLTQVPVEMIRPAEWNPNRMDGGMRDRLAASIRRFGVVVPIVVRRRDSSYETVGGAQRLEVLKGLKVATVPCVVVEADDAQARLLSQALNHIAGEEDLGLRAAVVRELLKAMPPEEILSVLPDSSDGLRELASMGEEDLAKNLTAWERARSVRFRHLQFQLTEGQLEVVEEALSRAEEAVVKDPGSPNRRGIALTAICREYLGCHGTTK